MVSTRKLALKHFDAILYHDFGLYTFQTSLLMRHSAPVENTHVITKKTSRLEYSVMTGTDIEAVIIKELRKFANDTTEVSPDTNIVRDLNLPSLDVMELVMSLEDDLDISIPLDRIADIETVQELAELVRTLSTKADV